MRTITRCPSCFTYVYEDAKACHGCGERIGKRKILRRGSWVLIALIVSAYAVGRGIELRQEKNRQIRGEFETAARSQGVTRFLRAWLVGDDTGVADALATGDGVCKDELDNLRDLYPTVLPATEVVDIELVKNWEERHQRIDGRITHVRSWSFGSKAKADADTKAKARLSASCKPTKPSGGGSSWTLPAVDFEATIKKDGASYTAFGRVCVDNNNKICCLTIDHIQGLESRVEPRD